MNVRYMSGSVFCVGLLLALLNGPVLAEDKPEPKPKPCVVKIQPLMNMLTESSASALKALAEANVPGSCHVGFVYKSKPTSDKAGKSDPLKPVAPTLTGGGIANLHVLINSECPDNIGEVGLTLVSREGVSAKMALAECEKKFKALGGKQEQSKLDPKQRGWRFQFKSGHYFVGLYPQRNGKSVWALVRGRKSGVGKDSKTTPVKKAKEAREGSIFDILDVLMRAKHKSSTRNIISYLEEQKWSVMSISWPDSFNRLGKVYWGPVKNNLPLKEVAMLYREGKCVSVSFEIAPFNDTAERRKFLKSTLLKSIGKPCVLTRSGPGELKWRIKTDDETCWRFASIRYRENAKGSKATIESRAIFLPKIKPVN